jgi:alpha-1,6-mannosyltransferase
MKDKEELARLYRTCDLVVHPSVNETFGLVPVEAQACGRLVAGLRGGNLELNIRAGLDTWAARNTPAGLAGTVRALAAIDRRPLEQAVAKAVREEFSWPKAFDQLWSVYRELLTSPSAHQWLPRI